MLISSRGATLIELVVSIAVLTIVVVTLLTLTSQSTGRSVDPMIQEQAAGIAQAYLEEIMQKGFCDPDFDFDADPATPLDCPAQCAGQVCQAGGCRNSGSAQEGLRGLYDDVCDYDGLSDSGAVDQNGTGVAGLDQYTIDVQVEDDAGVDLNGLTGAAGQAALITITVSHPAMQDEVRVSGYRANY
ncbi:MAG: prepilin-type N-terminal cleavage/methylation domain-containing protein [Gammaproteobacteria bacterium]|nr:prepilin-type N-terminal cleavage/methylation domain-containing protein [Gammaproteobacteria bacterium]